MAGPNRPDDSPMDFSFLHQESEPQKNSGDLSTEDHFTGFPKEDTSLADLTFDKVKIGDSTEVNVPSGEDAVDQEVQEPTADAGGIAEPLQEPEEIDVATDLTTARESVPETLLADAVPEVVEPPESAESPSVQDGQLDPATPQSTEVQSSSPTSGSWPVAESTPETETGTVSESPAVPAFAPESASAAEPATLPPTESVGAPGTWPVPESVEEPTWPANMSAPELMPAIVPLPVAAPRSKATKPEVKPPSPASVPAASTSAAAASSAAATTAPEKSEKTGVSHSPKASSAILGYAIAVTLLLLFLFFTGRIVLVDNHTLESLPDLRPLAPNEFRRVPDGTPLPEGHVLKIGESQKFGDVVVTPVRVTREPLKFEHFQSAKPEESLTSSPVLKLWLRFENLSGSYGFPPYDAELMSDRSPPTATDDSAKANSFLMMTQQSEPAEVRVLNYLQTMDDNFILTGQQLGKVILPKETLDTYVACSEDFAELTVTPEAEYTWRVQIRKGVHEPSGNGVTTLIDVQFTGAEIAGVTDGAENL